VDIKKKLQDIELRLANIEAALRSHNIWPEHLRKDPAFQNELKRDFKERGVEAIHEFNRSKQEEEYQEAKLKGKYTEVLVYKNRLRRKGYLYNNCFYFRWGTGLRAVAAEETEVIILGEITPSD